MKTFTNGMELATFLNGCCKPKAWRKKNSQWNSVGVNYVEFDDKSEGNLYRCEIEMFLDHMKVSIDGFGENLIVPTIDDLVGLIQERWR